MRLDNQVLLKSPPPLTLRAGSAPDPVCCYATDAFKALILLRNVIAYLTNAVKLFIVALHGISEMIRQGDCLSYTYLVRGESVLDLIKATIQFS